MRDIAIGTPCYGGVTANYANSLAASVSLFAKYNINLFPILLSHQSVIQMARNRMLKEVIISDADDLVWVDSDIGWKPEDLLKLCLHEEDVVGATYRKKLPDTTHFTLVLFKDKQTPDGRGLLEVSRLGTGFFRMSKKAMLEVCSTASEYLEESGTIKNVFEVGVRKGEFLSEDFFLCEKLKDLGYKIMLDTKIDLTHEGTFSYRGSISHYLESIKKD